MNRARKMRRGFSLVELLAVVLILAVLAAVAVPLYLNTRRTSAARACKANINAIASAEAAFALRHGVYTDLASLAAGGPEGISGPENLYCPLDRTAYTITGAVAATVDASGNVTGGDDAAITISCGNQTTHQNNMGVAATVLDWQRTMPAITGETAIP